MRWPREDVENDRRIHLPVPSIPGPLTPPGPNWQRRKSRQHRATAQPSPPQFFHDTRQGEAKRRRNSPLDVTRLWSDKTDPPPSLPPSWGCLAATQEAAPVLTAELARSCKGGNSTFPAGVEALPPGTPPRLSPELGSLSAGPSCLCCELTHREHSGYLLLPFFPAILFF